MTVKSTTDVDRAVGFRIAALRKAKGLSQTELGQHIGVTFQQIQKYEKGVNRVSSGRLQQIAQFLKVPMPVLFGEGEPQGQNEIFPFLANPGAIEILAAYASIEDRDLRRDVLSIVRAASRLRGRQTD